MYAFRPPTLLNLEVTGPWSHAGAYTRLVAVVPHHLDPDAAIANYDFSQLDLNVQAQAMQTNTQFALDTHTGRQAVGAVTGYPAKCQPDG
jgi:cytochrome c peroxidase